jgi:hypothetical protein
MKDTVHSPVHRSVHLDAWAGVRTRRAYTPCGTRLGRGQNRVLGWNDPGLDALPRPKICGVVPAQRDSSPFARASFRIRSGNKSQGRCPSEECKNCRLHLRSCHVFTLRSDIRPALNEFPRPYLQKSPHVIPSNRAGATPLFGSQSAQKFCSGRSRSLLSGGTRVSFAKLSTVLQWSCPHF